MKDVLNKLVNLLIEKHANPFLFITKDELDSYINDLLDEYSLDDEYDLMYVFGLIVKRMFGKYDSHTEIIVDSYIRESLPIKFKVIDGDVRVIGVNNDDKELMFGKLLSVNEVDINVLIDDISKVVSYSTDEWLDVMIADWLHLKMRLKSLPSFANNGGNFTYKILLDDGSIKDVSFESDKMYGDTVDIKLPFKYGRGFNYSYEVIDDYLRIGYSSCKEDYKDQMSDFIHLIDGVIEEYKLDKVILDLRGNSGGNSRIILPLINYLSNYNVTVLVNEEVFSSGLHAIDELRKINATFVGSNIGSQFNRFGDISTEDGKRGFKVKVGEDKYLYLHVCRKVYYHDPENDFETNALLRGDFEEFIKAGKLDYILDDEEFYPDYYVTKTLDDYKDGFDRELDYVINDLNNSKVK